MFLCRLAFFCLWTQSLLLCVVNIFNSTAEKFPRNADAINQWILCCLLFIILAILEYTLLLGYKKYKKEDGNENDVTGYTRQEEINIRKISKKLDRWMLSIFPPTFTVFTILFWLLYSQKLLIIVSLRLFSFRWVVRMGIIHTTLAAVSTYFHRGRYFNF